MLKTQLRIKSSYVKFYYLKKNKEFLSKFIISNKN